MPDDKPVEPTPVSVAASSPEITPVTAIETAPAQADQVPVVAPAVEEVLPAVGADATKADAPIVEPTLLEKFDAEQRAEAEKPKPIDAEVKPEAKTEEVKLEAPKLDPIDYFAPETGVKLPETIKLDDAGKAEVVTAFDAFRADPKAGAQALIDLHNKQMVAHDERIRAKQWETFAETRKGWRDQVMADPVLGGSGYQTAMHDVADVRDTLVSRSKPGTPEYAKDQAEFSDMLRVTGVGDHPAFLRLLHNGARFFKEASESPRDPSPPPNNGRPPRGKGQLSYANTEFPK